MQKNSDNPLDTIVDNTRNNRKYETKTVLATQSNDDLNKTITNKLLPTIEEFKRKAKQLKIDNKYEKLGYAQMHSQKSMDIKNIEQSGLI